MGWWVSLLLVLAPRLPGHPGIQPVEHGLWQWMVLMPWLPGVRPCLLCFGPPMQWTRLCHDITRTSLKGPQQQHCLEALAEAAVPLAPVTVGSGQREALQEIIMDALHFLEKQKEIRYQPAARIFQCATCRLVDCQFPLDCPVQDVWVHEDEATTLHCDVPFAVPPDLPITWMFAKDGLLVVFLETSRASQTPVTPRHPKDPDNRDPKESSDSLGFTPQELDTWIES
ncbi:sperm acrosome membrane-associated protein 6 isoform X4 [Cygnus olor]|uniref:sperm acrosome membrane-associated protein 6 isoform X4 n=1 Tax=Cygnus olor TaxID=8869 RepID=UPI001ADE635A|nr:sperm acrosome membrane-associated protein 6 isoform X4 [Cygnus olor]